MSVLFCAVAGAKDCWDQAFRFFAGLNNRVAVSERVSLARPRMHIRSHGTARGFAVFARLAPNEVAALERVLGGLDKTRHRFVRGSEAHDLAHLIPLLRDATCSGCAAPLMFSPQFETSTDQLLCNRCGAMFELHTLVGPSLLHLSDEHGPALCLDPLAWEGGNAVVGRASNAELQIRSDMVSRRHAHLLFSDGVIRIVDFNSSGGTYVNGQRLVAEHILCDDDELSLGVDRTVTLVPRTPPRRQDRRQK